MNKTDSKTNPLARMNTYGKSRTPFIFIIDFKIEKPVIIPLSKVNPKEILFNINGFTNQEDKTFTINKENGDPVNSIQITQQTKEASPSLIKKALPYKEYLHRFNLVQENLRKGNSYLLNLTQPTEIQLSISLNQIYNQSKAPYKLWVKEQFTLFSPECFIRIQGRRISSFPMKGTIPADIKNAEELLLNNEKEKAEHITIVDLIRNDLNQVAEEVHVDRFRYLEKVTRSEGDLLQASSEISGILPEDYHNHLGDLFLKLLPAGSITGAPKRKTVDIIDQAEEYERGYYTGVYGYYDGCSLESAVMIRFIEVDKSSSRFFYKSGGGITIYSNPEDEYKELIDKIYLPF